MQEVTSLCHLIMVWPQKPKKNENNKHTRPYMQVREATQPYAETRDPPSQDPRDSHYCTLNRFSTVAGPLAGVSDNCWVLAIVNLFLMHAFGDTVEQYRYVWCKSLCGCFFWALAAFAVLLYYLLDGDTQIWLGMCVSPLFCFRVLPCWLVLTRWTF